MSETQKNYVTTRYIRLTKEQSDVSLHIFFFFSEFEKILKDAQ